MQNTQSGTDPKTWAMIVWGLYIASYFTGITAIVGLIIAYVKRGDLAGTPFESHMTSAIRTFWITLIAGIIGSVLLFAFGLGLIVWAALCVWNLFRIIRGMIRAADGRPIDDPTGWL